MPDSMGDMRYVTYGRRAYHLWSSKQDTTLCGQPVKDATRYDTPPGDCTLCRTCERIDDERRPKPAWL